MAHRRANWRQSHSEVIQALHALRRAGTEIIYIPGAPTRHPRDRRRPPAAGGAWRRLRRRDPLRRAAGKDR
ncbi:hypothetical protein G6F23_015291 [Rhizopus arrhizus]|nr:hypothetical protein G6F23_015291 [Rhizopus arrhizus]